MSTNMKSFSLRGFFSLFILLITMFSSCHFGPDIIQLTIQIEKESVVISTSGVTVNSGEATSISADMFSDYVFTKWQVVSGSASIADASKPATSVTITSEATIKAVYLKAYGSPFNGHYYMVYNDAKTWLHARAACEQKGGYLATITSQEEQSFVYIVLSRPEATNQHNWIGGFQPSNSAEPNGSWQWVTGEQMSFSYNFSPSNSGSGEDSIEIYKSDGAWNDNAGSTNSYSYICEWGWEDTYIQKKSFNGHMYAFADISMTWDQAKDYCVKLDGHLATINSQAEQSFIDSVYTANTIHTTPKTYYWLGGYQQASSTEPGGGWLWVTGEAISSSLVYTNWITGQPDNTSSADKLMLRSSDGQWSDEITNPGVVSSTGILIEWEQ